MAKKQDNRAARQELLLVIKRQDYVLQQLGKPDDPTSRRASTPEELHAAQVELHDAIRKVQGIGGASAPGSEAKGARVAEGVRRAMELLIERRDAELVRIGKPDDDTPRDPSTAEELEAGQLEIRKAIDKVQSINAACQDASRELLDANGHPKAGSIRQSITRQLDENGDLSSLVEQAYEDAQRFGRTL
jgi:hypothetical protein